MKNLLIAILCMFLVGSQTMYANGFKAFLATSNGAGATATLGGYAVPGIIYSYISSSPKGMLKALPSALGAGVACILQQKGYSAKWGCNKVTRLGNIATLLTYFGCAFIADEIAQQIPGFGKDHLDGVGRAGITTLFAYAFLAGRDSILGK